MNFENVPSPNRREWLAAAIALGLSGRAVGARADTPAPEERSDSAALDQARRAGLKGLGTTRSAHYVAVGDANEAFRSEALALCERLAGTFRDHFQAKGFEVELPETPMTVVALAGRKSYGAFKGSPVGDAEGGHYEVTADRLVIFDFRGGEGGGPPLAADARRINTFTLVHEAMHQLTFDTGLLGRGADVPVAVSEGFATYGELWQDSRRVIGQVNRPRLAVLATPGGADWIPIDQLLAEDGLFRRAETVQLAYAEAWLLVSQFLKTRTGTNKLRSFLDRLKQRTDETRRVDDASETLGDPGKIDRDLRRAANLLIRR